jgi:hypothetical protein
MLKFPVSRSEAASAAESVWLLEARKEAALFKTPDTCVTPLWSVKSL